MSIAYRRNGRVNNATLFFRKQILRRSGFRVKFTLRFSKIINHYHIYGARRLKLLHGKNNSLRNWAELKLLISSIGNGAPGLYEPLAVYKPSNLV